MEKETDEEDSGKGVIIFGLINIVLVVIHSRIRVFLISSAMILLLGTGIAISVDAYKKGKKVIGGMGCILNMIAILIYGGEFILIIIYSIRKFLGFFG